MGQLVLFILERGADILFKNFDDVRCKHIRHRTEIGVGKQKYVGWVEERNPTFPRLYWVTLAFHPTYNSSIPCSIAITVIPSKYVNKHNNNYATRGWRNDLHVIDT
jgi:hypothetical protein